MSHAEHLGSDTMLYVDVPGMGLMTARVGGEDQHAVGARIGLTPREGGGVHRFDAEGRTVAG